MTFAPSFEVSKKPRKAVTLSNEASRRTVRLGSLTGLA